MYAKLVLNANTSVALCMRDIARLCTSQNPNVANLEGYSQTSSVIIDATPAGWSYVMGTECNITTSAPQLIRFSAANSPSGPAIGATINTANVIEQHTMSANCLAPLDAKLKYASLTSYSNCSIVPTTATHRGFSWFFVTGAANVNTTTGVLTGESYRSWHFGSTGNPYAGFLGPIAGNTHHVIANERHITVIAQNRGVGAVWETSQSEADVFYNSVPSIAFYYANAAGGTGFSTSFLTTPTSTAGGFPVNANIFDHTIPATGINASVRAISALNPFLFIWQTGQNTNNSAEPGTARSTGSSSNGLTRHFVTPILFQSFDIGVPIKFVTGVVPIYMMKGGSGTMGDIVTINGVDYTYFEVIPSAAADCQPLAFAMLTY